MLLQLLSDYLNQVEQAIVQCENAYVELYQEEILTSQRANLRIRLRFNQTHLLEINEAIVITDNYLEFLDYRYHFQDEKNNLVFRYDSTPHFPNLSTFPHHKHLPNDVISCHKPEITQVLKEATELLR
ncbi:MAG: toxin TumE [Microcystis sp.]|uniref:toxin TumE n=1 Tax=Microcystis sp. TaxID=1127 RepID=UPI00391A56FA